MPLLDVSMRAAWLIAAVLALGACKEAPSVAPSVAYSPFTVEVEGHGAFDVVTFKHVGAQSLPEPSFHFEAVAEALAMSLERRDLETAVVYDAKLTHHDAHYACSIDRLYVDFWPVSGGWGYSLWSGCGEDDRFEWQEFSSTATDPTTQMTELADHIGSSLSHADARHCYAKAC